MDSYVPGAVAGILGSSPNILKTPEEKKLKCKQRALLVLFSKSKTERKQCPESLNHELTLQGKSARKRKNADSVVDKLTTPTKKAKKAVEGMTECTTVTPEKTKNPLGREDQRENRKKKKDPEKDIRTIFVGNLPNTIIKRTVKTFFKKYGVVESIRFRSAAPSDIKLPKKAIMNTKSFHKELRTMNGYVVFKKKKAAKDALAGNGEVLEGNHIRVDLAKDARKVDTRRSIFVGNLPFDVSDDQLRAHFQDCGKIEGIRVIRENRTGLGKGIGYVKFEDKDGVDMALRLNGHLFSKRTLRIQKAGDVSKIKDKKKASTTGGGHRLKKADTTGKKKKNTVGRSMPSNVTSRNFQGVKAKSLENIKKLQKQKKKLKKQKKTGGEAVKGKMGVVSTKGRPNKGNAARARIAKKIKKANPRKT